MGGSRLFCNNPTTNLSLPLPHLHRIEQRTVYSALLNTFIDPGDSISISEFPSKLLRLCPFAISISEIHRSCIFSAARTGQDDINLPLLSTYTIHILPPLNIVVGRNQ